MTLLNIGKCLGCGKPRFMDGYCLVCKTNQTKGIRKEGNVKP